MLNAFFFPDKKEKLCETLPEIERDTFRSVATFSTSVYRLSMLESNMGGKHVHSTVAEDFLERSHMFDFNSLGVL